MTPDRGRAVGSLSDILVRDDGQADRVEFLGDSIPDYGGGEHEAGDGSQSREAEGLILASSGRALFGSFFPVTVMQYVFVDPIVRRLTGYSYAVMISVSNERSEGVSLVAKRPRKLKRLLQTLPLGGKSQRQAQS